MEIPIKLRKMEDEILKLKGEEREKKMKPIFPFIFLLRRNGYSKKAIQEIWKWYDFSEKKGAASW